MDPRPDLLRETRDADYDVVIVGGGVNGAALYHLLRGSRLRVLLVDLGDFAGGTSQASGMLVWGGLLYLQQLHLATVMGLSLARERLLREMGGWVRPAALRYVPAREGGRSAGLVLLGTYLYWLLGLCRREPPRRERDYQEAALLRPDYGSDSVLYQEGALGSSDCRFVLHWLTAPADGQTALNYCALEGGEYRGDRRRWALSLRDTLGGERVTVSARAVVNCAGVWTDRVNGLLGVNSPYRHALSKGVYLGLRRHPEHRTHLVVDMGQHRDVLTYVPWGPVALWGPTETAVERIEDGFEATAEDVAFLLERAAVDTGDVVSVRVGLRPLAVPAGYRAECYPLELSRAHHVVRDVRRRLVSVYGGKFTGALTVAREAMAALAGMLGLGRLPTSESEGAAVEPDLAPFPGLQDPVPSATWCRDHESCHTLADYLRRRTNIAQWLPRGGLGTRDEHLPAIRAVASTLARGDEALAWRWVTEYVDDVRIRFDALLAAV